MRKTIQIILLGLLILLTMQSHGQESNSLSLLVLDSERATPIDGAICELLKGASVLGYAISNPKGVCRLKLKTGADSVLISMMGYSPRRIALGQLSRTGQNRVLLTPSLQEIEEVHVHAAPVTRKGDTIAYNVEAIRKDNDRYIGKVLEKIPGVEVKPSGAIEYKGRPINRFYIEGRDLLGGQYNQATANLPTDAVAQVQIMEKHQPVKMLRGKESSDRAAINLKLKRNYWVRPFGEIAAGAGYPFPLWDGKLFLMQVAKRNQLMVQGQTNNHGRSLQGNLESLEGYDNQLPPAPPSPVLYHSSAQQPPVAEHIYLDNQSVSWGVNDLVPLGRERHLRVNALGVADRRNASHARQREYIDTETPGLEETHASEKTAQGYHPAIEYEDNSKTFYLRNQLGFQYEKERSSSQIQSNGTPLELGTGNLPWRVENGLKLSLARGNVIYHIKSYSRFFERDESMRRESAADGFQSGYRLREFLTENRVGNTLYLRQQPLRADLLLGYSHNEYRANALDTQGNAQLDQGELGGRLSTEIRWTDIRLHIHLPLSLHPYRLHMEGQPEKRDYCYLEYRPSVRLTGNIQPHWDLEIGGSYGKDLKVENFYTPIGIRSNYRTRRVLPNALYEGKSVKAHCGATYENLLSMFFGGVSLSYTYRLAPYFWSHTIGPRESLITPIYRSVGRHFLLASLRLDKKFLDQGVDLFFKGFYSQNRGEQMLSNRIVRSEMRAGTLSLRASVSLWEDWQLDYDCIGNAFWQGRDIRQAMLGAQQRAKLHWNIGWGFSAQLSYAMQTNEIAKRSFQTSHFLDGELVYRIPNSRLELSAWVHNALGEKWYSLQHEQPLYRERMRIPLRGREFLLRILVHI